MLEWNDSFLVGIEKIDIQHKQIFEFMKKLLNYLDNFETHDEFDEIIEIIDKLQALASNHFKTEEDLFIKYNYPDYEDHKKEHDKFKEYFKDIDTFYIDNNQKETLQELILLVGSLIFKHLSNIDYKYSEFLKDAMNK